MPLRALAEEFHPGLLPPTDTGEAIGHPAARLTPARKLQEIRYASLLHDFGKLGVIGICYRLSERCADPIEHRDAEYNLASPFVHLRQDHVAKVVNHARVCAGEIVDEFPRFA